MPSQTFSPLGLKSHPSTSTQQSQQVCSGDSAHSVGLRNSQRQRHVLLHPLQRIEQRWNSVASMLVLMHSGAAHRQHILIMEVMELCRRFVITVTSTLSLSACGQEGQDSRVAGNEAKLKHRWRGKHQPLARASRYFSLALLASRLS